MISRDLDLISSQLEEERSVVRVLEKFGVGLLPLLVATSQCVRAGSTAFLRRRQHGYAAHHVRDGVTEAAQHLGRKCGRRCSAPTRHFVSKRPNTTCFALVEAAITAFVLDHVIKKSRDFCVYIYTSATWSLSQVPREAVLGLQDRFVLASGS